jgi:hypothetical protein
LPSWTEMATGPTAWPLHENTMLEEERRLIQQELPFHETLSLRNGNRNPSGAERP